VRRKSQGPEPQPNPQRFSVQDPSSEIRPLREENEEPQLDAPLPLNPPKPPYLVSQDLYQQPQQGSSKDRLTLNRVNTDPSIQQQSYQQRPEHDLPHGQVNPHHPAHYYEDIQQPTPVHPQYQAFPPPPNHSSQYAPYQVPPNLQPKSNPQSELSRFRPPSQQSLGPPSPLSQQTSFEINRQSQDYRNSLQNFQPPPTPQSQGPMAPSSQNAQLRGMNVNQQNPQAPPIRSDSMQEQGHNHGGQYREGPPQSANRHLSQNPPDQGRASPQPLKSRGDSSDVDMGSLLQKHDDLSKSRREIRRIQTTSLTTLSGQI
jgi:hypothetical protein